MQKIYSSLLITWLITLLWSGLFASLAFAAPPAPVTATEDAARIVMDNGIARLEVSKAKGNIVSVRYRHDGQDTEISKTMYTSASAGPTDRNAPQPPRGSIQTQQNRPPHLALNTPEIADVQIESGPNPTFPFHMETHYLLMRGQSGFYAYQIYSRAADLPAATIGEARFVIKGLPGTSVFTDHVVDAQRMGPVNTSPVAQQVSDATFLLQDGSIYTKYDNSAFMADHYVHGMTGHGIGLWMLNASNEFVNGGPLKQELTVHADNTLLNMLQGAHFGSGVLNFKVGETWTKFYGPCFVYLNTGATTQAMYQDALRRVEMERAQWPYAWVSHPAYPTLRGSVKGQIKLTDGTSAKGAWIVLAAESDSPQTDWTQQGKGYEFWTRAGADGSFTIPKVRPGAYTLYACGANQFAQFHKDDVTIQAGETNNLGVLDWKPVTHGKTLWQIGVADRGTTEFHDGNNVRHFANYLRYAKDFPDDVTFTIGKSREDRDWNFAQWTWYSKRPYWAIDFDLPQSQTGTATLTFGIAASNPAHGGSNNIQIKVNGQDAGTLHLAKSGPAAYRSGGQDSLYRVETVTFAAALLKAGANEITLGHADAQPLPTPEEQKKGQVGAVMYDAIRLEVEPKEGEAKPAQESGNLPVNTRRLPTLFLIGDSTVKNHTKGLAGWGDSIGAWFDTSRLHVENEALGGRSSRTFLTEGLWDKVVAKMQPGDFVLMQFGHNDGGSIATSYRASLKGNGEETQEATDAKTGKKETVHSYGWYMRRYIADVKRKGATPIVLSLVPRNIWKPDNTIGRASSDYGKWAQEAAEAENVAFVDLNDIVAKHYEALGPDKVKEMYFPGDHTHTNQAGAERNAASVVEGLRMLKDCPLTPYLRDKPAAPASTAASK